MSDSTITIQAAIEGFDCKDASVSEQFVSERAANGRPESLLVPCPR
jgi:hypothetical protein